MAIARAAGLLVPFADYKRFSSWLAVFEDSSLCSVLQCQNQPQNGYHRPTGERGSLPNELDLINLTWFIPDAAQDGGTSGACKQVQCTYTGQH